MRSITRVSAVSLLFVFVSVGLAGAGCGGRHDARINEDVKAQLGPTTAGTPVAISTKDRIVTLQGVVRTSGERLQIEDAVRHVDGVLAVDNRLTVASPTETTGAPIEKRDLR